MELRTYNFPNYPINTVLPALREALGTHGTCLLEAPPGAGKTTIVPLDLLDEAWSQGPSGRILMLEPRRLAARSAAERMAHLAGEAVGHTIGYSIRNESRVSASTRVEVVTEGILARRLARDPDAPGVACVIFDEFHERSVHADVGLGLTLMSKAMFRPDLKILVMSATLSAATELATLLGGAPVVRSEGRMYPVSTVYLHTPASRPVHLLMASAVHDALRDAEGDILCFLPGLADIRRTQAAITEAMPRWHITPDVEICVLHGESPSQEQQRIIGKGQKGVRRIILSTNIAETSVTIDGVRTVVDSGLVRIARFDAGKGMTRLVTTATSTDSADQRRGRAGRQAPGTCIRLWTADEHQRRDQRTVPDILHADLAPVVMDAAAFGTTMADIPWLDVPPAAAVRSATALLLDLGALTAAGTLTGHGRAMNGTGLHPRLAHMIIRAREHALDMRVAYAVALLLGERDILRTSSDADIRRRILVAFGHTDDAADSAAVQRLRTQLRRHVPLDAGGLQLDHAGQCVALAYPDRVAKRRPDGRYAMVSGATARVDQHDALRREDWLAVAELSITDTDSVITMASPMDEGWLEHIGKNIVSTDEVTWNDRTEQLVARRVFKLGAIVLREEPLTTLSATDRAMMMARILEEREWKDLPWTPETTHLYERWQFAQHHGMFGDAGAQVPFLTPDSVAPHITGKRSLADVGRMDLHALLSSVLPGSQRRFVDAFAPATYTAPTGRTARIDYSDPGRPVLRIRLQDLFGVYATPAVARGAVTLTVELLSPAGRPIQVTQDLGGFWQGSYAQVRKELRGRYPKHNWPEKP